MLAVSAAPDKYIPLVSLPATVAAHAPHADVDDWLAVQRGVV